MFISVRCKGNDHSTRELAYAVKNSLGEKTLEQQLQDDMKVVLADSTQQTIRNIDQEMNKKKSLKRLQDMVQGGDSILKKRPKSEKLPVPSVRFDNMNHLPKIDKTRQVRCKNESCKNKKTYIFCSKCQVHLCICVVENRNCFEEFHTINKTDA